MLKLTGIVFANNNFRYKSSRTRTADGLPLISF